MNKRQKIVQQAFINNEEAIIKRLKQVYGQSLKDIEKKSKLLHDEFEKMTAEYDLLDDEEDLLTLATRRGTLTLEMIRSNAGDDIPVSIECTIVAKAVEKDEVVEEESPAEIFCKQLGYSYGMLAPTTYNDILDDPDHGEGSTETYCCSNDPDFNEYDGYDEEGELVSINGTPIQDPQTFCESKYYSNGMLNPNTYTGTDDEYGDITQAYYLCSNDPEFGWQIVGFDVEGNWVYEFMANDQ